MIWLYPQCQKLKSHIYIYIQIICKMFQKNMFNCDLFQRTIAHEHKYRYIVVYSPHLFLFMQGNKHDFWILTLLFPKLCKVLHKSIWVYLGINLLQTSWRSLGISRFAGLLGAEYKYCGQSLCSYKCNMFCLFLNSYDGFRTYTLRFCNSILV